MNPSNSPATWCRCSRPAEWAKTIEPYDKQLAELDVQLKQAADSLVAQSNEFKAAVTASPSQNLARGVIADGGSQPFEAAPEQTLGVIDVKVGQMIQLTIDPQSNYGADTTLIEWTVSARSAAPSGSGIWRRTSLADFLAANPHADRLGNPAVWLFLDGRGGPSMLARIGAATRPASPACMPGATAKIPR